MSLEGLEKKLYSREKFGKEEKNKGEAFAKKKILGWKEERKPAENKKNFFSKWKKNLLFGAIVFFIIATGIGAFYLYQAFYSEGIDVILGTPEGKIYYGVPFKMEAAVHNSSGKNLESVSITLSLPEGFYFAHESEGQKIQTKEVGMVENENLSKVEFELLASPTTDGAKTVEATVSYKTAGAASSRFEEKGSKEISIDDSSISADIVLPEKVYSGENFEMEISYRNDLEEDIEQAILEVIYPEEFNFVSSDGMKPMDTAGKNWKIENLKAGEEGKIKIKGNVVGLPNSFFEIKAKIKKNVYGQNFSVFEKSKGFSIQSSPLSLSVLVNESDDYVSRPDDSLRYSLNYENNTGMDLKDVVIAARLEGAMFDVGTISGNGFFNSINKTIIWNASNDKKLASISAGDSGKVEFTISTKSSYPIYKANDKNFVLKVTGQMESPTVAEGVGAFKTTAIGESQAKVRGKAEITSKVLRRDSAIGEENGGPWPMKAEESTEFTVHWTIKNYATDISEIAISSFLNPGVRWKGIVKSNASSVPEYNERTQEISWNMDSIPATKGFIGEPIEVVFQIEATPSTLSVGNYFPLIGKAEMTAKDSFTGAVLTAEDEGVTTRLPDDLTVGSEEGRVLPK